MGRPYTTLWLCGLLLLAAACREAPDLPSQRFNLAHLDYLVQKSKMVMRDASAANLETGLK
jgi:hypothetical protein